MSSSTREIAAVPLFADLSSAELESIAARTRPAQAAPGTAVITQGEAGTEFFVVLSGSLEIQLHGRAVDRMGPGDFLGELALLFNFPRTATAVAVEPTEMLVIDQADFMALLDEFPAVESKVMAAVAKRMRYR